MESHNRSSFPSARPSGSHDAKDGGTAVDLLNINEVASALRISKMTVYRLVRDGRLPAVRIGNSLRVHRADLDTYLHDSFLPPSVSGEERSG